MEISKPSPVHIEYPLSYHKTGVCVCVLWTGWMGFCQSRMWICKKKKWKMVRWHQMYASNKLIFLIYLVSMMPGVQELKTGSISLPDTHTASARMGHSQQKQPTGSCGECLRLRVLLKLRLDQFNMTSSTQTTVLYKFSLGWSQGSAGFHSKIAGFFGDVYPMGPRGINPSPPKEKPTPSHSNEALPEVFARFLHIGDHEEQGVSKVSNDRLVQVLS